VSSSSDTQVLVRNSGTGKVTYNTSVGSDTVDMGDGFTVSATTDTNATTITENDDLFFAAGAGITCETTADGTVTITNTATDDDDDLNVTADDGSTTIDLDTEQLSILGGTNCVANISPNTVTINATDTNTQLTDEQVEDIVGDMVSGNTETNITVTYQDSDGTLDFAVATQAEYLEESFNLYTRSLTGTTGTSTGTIMDHTVSTMSAFTVGVSLTGMTFAQAIKGSTRCVPGARTIIDGRLVISGTGDTQGTLAIFKATVCYDAEQPAEPPMTLMGIFSFDIGEGGDEAPECIDISIVDGEILPTQTVVPVLYNFGSTERHTLQGICTLTWQKSD